MTPRIDGLRSVAGHVAEAVPFARGSMGSVVSRSELRERRVFSAILASQESTAERAGARAPGASIAYRQDGTPTGV